jgi:hypothetical protein
VTLDHPEMGRYLTLVPLPERLRIVLSQEEVARLIEAAPGVKYKAAFAVAYGAGLRERRTPSSPPSRAISHTQSPGNFHKISPHLLLERTGSSQPLPLTPISRTSAAPSAPAQSP